MSAALVIEDDSGFARTLARVLSREGYDVTCAGTIAAGRAALANARWDLVVLDHELPDGVGIEFLPEAVGRPERPVVVMVTGVDRLSNIAEAIRLGAYDYFVKPPDLDNLLAVIGRARREREIRDAVAQRGDAATTGDESSAPRARVDDLLIGRSPAMQRVYRQLALVAQNSSSVLLTGESGTGKELVARAIHEVSPRHGAPFCGVNCAALRTSLVESELFGHVKGAFTGAARDRPGRFELVAEGTLLLDEVGELDLEVQGKLLRALEERVFERVGEAQPRPLRARLICATHRDLQELIDQGRFRADLYFRIGVVHIKLPPLRERGADVGLIAQHLLRRAGARLDKSGLVFAPSALERLAQFDWPGNVRQLRNVVEYCATMARDVITPEYLAEAGVRERSDASRETSVFPEAEEGLAPDSPDAAGPPQTLAAMERAHILATLERLGWVKKEVATALGISRPTLDRKIKLYGLAPGRQR